MYSIFSFITASGGLILPFVRMVLGLCIIDIHSYKKMDFDILNLSYKIDCVYFVLFL